MKKALCSLMAFSVLVVLITSGCGGGDTSSTTIPAPTSSNQWVKVDSISTTETSTHLSGSAWVSDSWVALHCSGLACLYDTSIDNYPGVDVTYSNLTTGASGTAASYYGGGTDWKHLWSATVPVIYGENAIQISVYDPDGKGGTITVTVVAVPAAPDQLRADPGDGQVTLSWFGVPDATDYTIYWATSPGVTKATGNGIPLADSPFVHTGLTNGLTYYYVVTATLNGVESGESQEVSTVAGLPSAPTGVAATAGNGQNTIRWDAAPRAASYNIYWSTTSDITKATGTKIPNVASPYVHAGLTNYTTYYYVVTTENSYGESIISAEVSVAPQSAPRAPALGTATSARSQVTVTWSGADAQATTYNIYWSTAPGVTKATGTKIPNVSSPYVHTGLTNYTTYYYVVTAENVFGESASSQEALATPPWTDTVVDCTGTSLTSDSIAVDSRNKVHISYNWYGSEYRPGYGWSYTYHLMYATDAGGSWVTSARDQYGLYSSIALDANDYVHISYLSSGLKYVTNKAGRWDIYPVDTTGDYTSLAMDRNGNAHISYVDRIGGGILKYATNASGAWVTSTVEGAARNAGPSSLAVGSNNAVHICYEDRNDSTLKCAENSSGAWNISAVTTQYTLHASMAMDARDVIHVSYFDFGGLKYATNRSGSWVSTVVDADPGMLAYSDITVDAGGSVHIVYLGYKLNYATNTSGVWRSSPIMQYGGSEPRIALGSNNSVHISRIRGNCLVSTSDQ